MPNPRSVRASLVRTRTNLYFLQSTLKDLSLSVAIGFHPVWLCNQQQLCANALTWLERASHELLEAEQVLRRKRGV
jgi:galactose mutarotase-like enzyme